MYVCMYVTRVSPPTTVHGRLSCVLLAVVKSERIRWL